MNDENKSLRSASNLARSYEMSKTTKFLQGPDITKNTEGVSSAACRAGLKFFMQEGLYKIIVELSQTEKPF